MRRAAASWEMVVTAGIGVLMLLLFLLAGDHGLPLRLESETIDLRFRLRSAPPPPVPVIIVEIDEASIAELGRWPWSRETFARLIDRIHDAGARVICLDLLLTEPQPSPLRQELGTIEAAMAPLVRALDPATRALAAKIIADLPQVADPDARLAEAIERDRPVVLPVALDLRPAAAVPAQRAQIPPALARAAFDRVRGSGPDFLPVAAGARLPVTRIAGHAALAHATTSRTAPVVIVMTIPSCGSPTRMYPRCLSKPCGSFLGFPRPMSSSIADKA